MLIKISKNEQNFFYFFSALICFHSGFCHDFQINVGDPEEVLSDFR